MLMFQEFTVPNTETYVWSANVGAANINNQDQSGLAADTYTLTITDPANNCQETETFIITEPDTLSVTAVLRPVGCSPTGNDGEIDITTMGGTAPYTYDWGNGITTEDRTMLPIGTYNLQITDANMCQISESFTIINQPTITVDLDSTDLSCFNDGTGAINLTTNANSPSFNWTDGTNSLPATQNQTGLDAGTYYVTVTDGITTCFGIDSITINEPTVLTATIDTTEKKLCAWRRWNCFCNSFWRYSALYVQLGRW